jgi:hypothetical protein
LDYAEPAQRALLVEGIRPVLPLIRNTPYGKRIQNKLQREGQSIEYGSYSNPSLVSMTLSNQGLSPGHPSRHLPQGLQANISDLYGNGGNVYGIPQAQAGFTQGHLGTPLHALQPQSIDGYVLQSTSGQGTHNSFNGASFTNVSPLTEGTLALSLNDPYQRSAFGYGM